MHFDIVLRSPKAALAIRYYEKNNMLSSLIRRGLVSDIVDYYLAADIQLRMDQFNYIIDHILRRFPTEVRVILKLYFLFIFILLFPEKITNSSFFLLKKKKCRKLIMFRHQKINDPKVRFMIDIIINVDIIEQQSVDMTRNSSHNKCIFSGQK